MSSRSRRGVAAWRAVLRGHRAWAAAIHGTQLTWGGGSRRAGRRTPLKPSFLLLSEIPNGHRVRPLLLIHILGTDGGETLCVLVQDLTKDFVLH